MWKLISIIIGIILCGIFFVQNMVKVPIRLIVTEALDINLSYLLLTSFILGYVVCMVLSVVKEVKRRDVNKAIFVEEDDEEE